MSKLKNYLLAGLALALVAICVYAYILKKQRDKLEEHPVAAVTPADIKAAVDKTFKDSSGFTHTQFRPNPAAISIPAGEVDRVVNKPLIDSIRQALDIKSSQLVAYMKISQTSQERELKALKVVDSLRQLAYYYKNKNIELTYTPGKDTSSNGSFSYKYNADVSVTQYSKRRKVLGLAIGSKETFIDVVSNDKNAKINGLETFQIKQSEPSFGLRVQALSSYNLNTKLFSPGVGAQIDFKKLSLTGAYYFNTDAKQFRPSIGLRYDLIRF